MHHSEENTSKREVTPGQVTGKGGTQTPWRIMPILGWDSCPSSSPSAVTFKCWHWPQWEQYGGLKSQWCSCLTNPELHFHAPRDQVTSVLGGSRTYVSLPFICLLTAECVSLLAPVLSKQIIWTERSCHRILRLLLWVLCTTSYLFLIIPEEGYEYLWLEFII